MKCATIPLISHRLDLLGPQFVTVTFNGQAKTPYSPIFQPDYFYFVAKTSFYIKI